MAYLDAIQDRIADDQDDRFEELVEAVRLGTVFAHESKAHQRWALRRRRKATSVDAAHGLAKLMSDYPGSVSHEMEFRN